MRLKSLFLTTLILCGIFFFGSFFVNNGFFKTKRAYALPLAIGGTEDEEAKVKSLEDQIKEYEDKIDDLKKKGKSIQKEIEQANSQIALTQLKIEQSLAQIAKKEKEIAKLTEDISDLKIRIENLIDSISYQEDILGERLRARYKTRETSPVIVIFGSSTINTLIQKTKYLKVMEIQDQKLLDEMNNTKKAFSNQKIIYEDTKKKEETLKEQLVVEKQNLLSYKTDLDKQKKEKEVLLNDTQNDESKYQDLLSKAKAELEAIQNIVNGIDFEDGEKINKGDRIAVMGNSGWPNCSSGAHLHFEVRKDGKVVNAEKYLKSKSLYVYDYDSKNKSIGSGNWDWPMKDPTITQRFGKTPWSYTYPSGQHDGIDMISSDTYIYAPDDGTIVNGSMGCYGSIIKYAAINHGNGVVSYYLHIR